MSVGARVLGIAVIATVGLLMPASPSPAQEDPCAAKDKRQACSYQCCGRRSCPPSCEVDCVKPCVDACSSPAQLKAYGERKRSLQLRCGNRSVR
jgi:hypothetical protein